LVYLINGNPIGFGHGGHKGVRKAIRQLINDNNLVFSNVEIATQSTINTIRVHHIKAGANLSPTYYSTEDCIHSVRKKVADYMEHDWKESKGIKSYSTTSNRSSRDNFYVTNTINLTDYFYWMRIKANYKDVDFLDFSRTSSSDEAYTYMKQYAVAHESYANALETLIAELKSMRHM
jgi:hypothetical protein